MRHRLQLRQRAEVAEESRRLVRFRSETIAPKSSGVLVAHCGGRRLGCRSYYHTNTSHRICNPSCRRPPGRRGGSAGARRLDRSRSMRATRRSSSAAPPGRAPNGSCRRRLRRPAAAVLRELAAAAVARLRPGAVQLGGGVRSRRPMRCGSSPPGAPASSSAPPHSAGPRRARLSRARGAPRGRDRRRRRDGAVGGLAESAELRPPTRPPLRPRGRRPAASARRSTATARAAAPI